MDVPATGSEGDHPDGSDPDRGRTGRGNTDRGGPGSEGRSGEAPRPRVSVPMVTFRHERFLRQAIESVVEQSLESWEIVLADDLSDDGTVALAHELVPLTEGASGPRLRILPHDRKFGPRQNFMRALRACRGDFVAQLDGDDFFIDRDRLSAAVAHLEAHPEHSGVFGSWLETDENGENGRLTEGFKRRGRTVFETSDFGPWNPAASVAVMFRNRLFPEFPGWYERACAGDWGLHVLNTLHGGPYAYIPRPVAAHRNLATGIWTGKNAATAAEASVETQALFLAHLPDAVTRAMGPEIARANLRAARSALRKGQPDAAEVYLGSLDGHRLTLAQRLVRAWRGSKARRGR